MISGVASATEHQNIGLCLDKCWDSCKWWGFVKLYVDFPKLIGVKRLNQFFPGVYCLCVWVESVRCKFLAIPVSKLFQQEGDQLRLESNVQETFFFLNKKLFIELLITRVLNIYEY